MKDDDIRVAMADMHFFIQQFEKDSSVVERINDLIMAATNLGLVIGLNRDRKLGWAETWIKDTSRLLEEKAQVLNDMVIDI